MKSGSIILLLLFFFASVDDFNAFAFISRQRSGRLAAETNIRFKIHRYQDLQHHRLADLPNSTTNTITEVTEVQVAKDFESGSVDVLGAGEESSNSNAVTAAILMVYFVQGALGLARLATVFYLKDDLHMPPAEAAALSGLSTLPWVVKPLYGFLSDGFPLFGFKRRSYLVLAGALGCASWLGLANPILAHDPPSALAFILGGSAAIAVSDVVADSVVVELSRKRALSKVRAEQDSAEYGQDVETQIAQISGDLQSRCWAAAAAGSILSAYFSGSLLETVDPRNVFLITSLFPLLTAAAALLIDEQRVTDKELEARKDFVGNVKMQVSQLWDTCRNPSIYLPVLFVFLWQATPAPDTAMFYFTTNELGFSAEFLGRVRLASSIASLVGVLTYRTWLRDVSTKQLIFWSSLVSVPLGLTQVLLTTHFNRVLGIPDTLFALTDSVVLSVLGQVAFMPLLTLAASLCPPGAEGTLFATLMSIYNAAGTLGSELGAGLTSLLHIDETHFDALTLLIVICNVSSLLPLLFINQLLGKDDDNEAAIRK